MLLRTETPEQICHRFAREIRTALRRANRIYLRYAEDLDGLRITVGAKRGEETVDESPELPPQLRVARQSTRDVYLDLGALRAELGERVRVMPADILDRQRRRDPETEPSRDTVNHALRDLRDRELAWSHLDRGWLLGREQGVLFSAGHSDSDTAPTPIDYAARMGHDSRVRSRGSAMNEKKYIWVPIEDGVCKDATDDDLCCPPGENIGDLKYITRRGSARTVKATRAELLEVIESRGGELARVRIGKCTLLTTVFGEWHKAGEVSPPEPGPRSPWPACTTS